MPLSVLPVSSEPSFPRYDKEIISVAVDHDCPEYGYYATQAHEPRTGGRYNLPYMRPVPGCRKVVIPEVEDVIREMNQMIKDPDLFRLFENCFPNTLDTSVTWAGVSSTKAQKELTFVTTGDIHAMWLRDSANQLQSYVSLLGPLPVMNNDKGKKTAEGDQKETADTSTTTTTTTSHKKHPGSNKLASIFRGAINLQSRYILASPHCNAFQPPAESGMTPGNDGNRADRVAPPYDHDVVFECKYELDSLAAFLQLSWDYFSRTGDAGFFIDVSINKGGGLSAADFRTEYGDGDERVRRRARRGRGRRGDGTDSWLDAVIAVLDTVEGMRQPTYQSDGKVPDSPYQFTRITNVATETLPNRGNGSPVKGGTGLVRSAFRPSDDATTFQFLIPANMMLAKYLGLCAEIVARVEKEEGLLDMILASQAEEAVLDKDAQQEPDDEAEGNDESVAERMRSMAKEIKAGVEKYGKTKHPDFGEIYAYEVDGYSSTNLMVSSLSQTTRFPFKGYLSLLTKSPRTMPTSPPSYPHP